MTSPDPASRSTTRADSTAPGTASGRLAAVDPAIAAMAFDRALEELQSTVARLEAGGQPLEEAIQLYERGVALHEQCAKLLADAELRVRRLVERAGGALDTIAESGEADPGA